MLFTLSCSTPLMAKNKPSTLKRVVWGNNKHEIIPKVLFYLASVACLYTTCGWYANDKSKKRQFNYFKKNISRLDGYLNTLSRKDNKEEYNIVDLQDILNSIPKKDKKERRDSF